MANPGGNANGSPVPPPGPTPPTINPVPARTGTISTPSAVDSVTGGVLEPRIGFRAGLLNRGTAETAPVEAPPKADPPPLLRGRSLVSTGRTVGLAASLLLLVALISGGGFFLASHSDSTQASSPAKRFPISSVPLSGIATASGSDLNTTPGDRLTVNGLLRAREGLVIAPEAQPATPELGQLYLSSVDQRLRYFDGAVFQTLAIATPSTLAPAGGGVQSLQGQTGAVVLTGGAGIALSGTTITNTGVITLTSASPGIIVGSDGSGNYTISDSPSGFFVSSLNSFTGPVTLQGTANRITLNNLAGTITLSTPQDINTTSAVNFGSLALGSPLAVISGGLGISTTPSNGQIPVGNGSGYSLSALTAGSGITITNNPGSIQISSSCPNCANASLSNLSSVAINANLLPQGAGSIDLGSNALTFRDLYLSGIAYANQIKRVNGGSSTTLTLLNPTATVTYQLQTAAAGTYDICTTVGNCTGVGGGVNTSGGTVNTLAKFTSSQGIGDSIITDNGSTVTIGGTLSVANVSTTSGGVTNTLTFATPASGNKTITIPNATGTLAVSASGPLSLSGAGNLSCATCVTSAVSSLNTFTGPITLQGTANRITVNNSAGTITLSTPQDINTTSSPTFANLTLSNPLPIASGGLAVSTTPTNGQIPIGNGSGYTVAAITAGTGITVTNGAGSIQISAPTAGTCPACASTSLDNLASVSINTSLLAQAAASIDLGSVANIFRDLYLSGTAFTNNLKRVNGANSTTFTIINPTAAVTYQLQSASAGTYDICTTAGNCAGVGGSVTTAGGTTGTIAKFTSANGIGDSIITDDGSGAITISGTLKVNTLTPTAALTVGATGQNLTLQGAAVSLTATSGGITNTLTFATPASSGKTITIPNASGTIAVSATGPLALDAAGNLTCATCLTSGGGGGSAGVSSLNLLTGDLTLQGTTNRISVVSAGATITLSTPQDINTTSSPIFSSLSLTTGNLSTTNGGTTNTLTFASPSGANKTITLPNQTGTVCVDTANCSSAALSNDANLAKLNGTGPQTFTGNNKFTGTLLSQNASDSAAAFQVQNAIGSTVIRADTTPLNSFFSNSNFEGTDVTPWVYLGTPGSVARDATQAYLGSDSLKVVTTANAGNGVKYVTGSGAGALAISTTYTLSWYAKLDGASSAFTDMQAVYARNGLNEVACTSQNTQTVVTGGWTRFTCQIVTDGTSPAAGAYLAIEQTGATAHTFYLDAVQIEASSNASAYRETALYLAGAVSSPIAFKNSVNSTTALQIQNAAGSTLLVADTLNSRIAIAKTSAAYTLDVGGSIGGTTIYQNGNQVCDTSNNCVASGGGSAIGGSGTSGTLPKFTGSQTIGNSLVTESGSTVTVGGTLGVNTITPTATLTVGAASKDVTLQGAAVSIAANSGGITNTLTFATPATSNKTITIPNASGTLAVSASGPISLNSSGNISCATCVTSAVASLNSFTGTVTLQGTANQVTVGNSAGVITLSTPQDINVTSAVSFGSLTLGTALGIGSGGLGVTTTPANGQIPIGNGSGYTVAALTAGTGITITNGVGSIQVSAPAAGTCPACANTALSNLSSVAINSDLLPQSAATIDLGSTAKTFRDLYLSGIAYANQVKRVNGASSTTISILNPTAAVTYQLQTAAAGTYDICTTAGNCTGVGGGVTTPGGTAGTLAKFTSAQGIGDSIITDDGSAITIGGTLKVNTLTPTAALTVGATSQNLTLQGATVSLTATNSGVTNTLTFATPASSNKTITIPNATGTVTVSASGPLVLDATGNITCPTCLTSGGGGGTAGVQSLNSLTGALTIAGTTNQVSVSPSGSTITISTPQDIATTSSPTFANLILGATGNANATTRKNMTVSGAVTAGDVVEIHTVDGQVTKSAASSSKVFGIATATNGSTAAQDIVTSGVYQVNADATALAPGDLLVTSTTAGLVTKAGSTASIGTVVGRALSTKSSGAAPVWVSLSLGGGGADSLQSAYTNSTTPEITVDGTRGALSIQDASSPIGANLFEVQSNGGGTKYFAVDANGASVAGNFNITGQYRLGGTQISSSALSNDANLAKLNGSQTFTGANIFQASGNVVSAIVKQNSNGSPTADIFAIQTANGSPVLQVTGPVANEAAVTLTSLGATRDLTLGSGSGTIILAAGVSTIQRTASGTLSLDLKDAGATTLSVTNSGAGVASIDVEGGVNIGAGQTYKVGGSQISSANLSNDANLAKLNGTGPQTFTGDNKFTGTFLLQNAANGTTAFQVQNQAGNNYLLVNTSGASVSVGDTSIASTVQIGNTTGAVTQTINIGTNSTASSTNNVNLGSSVAGTVAVTGPTTITNRTSGAADSFNVSNSTSTGTIAKFLDNATTVFQLADGGAALFQNQTDSSSAFRVQNAAGSAVLTVDTTKGLVNQTPIGASYQGGASGWGSANADTSVSTFQDISVVGRYAYTVTLGTNSTCTGTLGNALGCELKIFDITVPGSPTYVGGADGSGTTNGGTVGAIDFYSITVSGRYAYISTKTNTGTPNCLPATSIAAGTANGCEMMIFDISNPATPTYLGGVDATGSANSGVGTERFEKISVSGQYAYAVKDGSAVACSQTAGSAAGCELQVYDVSSPATPRYVGGGDVSGSTNSGTAGREVKQVSVSGRYAYITTAGDLGTCSATAGSAIGCELQIWDISTPATPVYKGGGDSDGTTNGGGSAGVGWGLSVSGHYAYLGRDASATNCNTAGNKLGCELQIWDVSNPSSPTFKGGADASGSTNSGIGSSSFSSVFVSGRYLYVFKAASATACSQAAGSAIGCELQIYDVSDPTAPAYKGGTDVTGTTNSGTGNVAFENGFVSGRYIYVAKDGDNSIPCSQTAGSANGCGLQVYDASGIEAIAITAGSLEAGSLLVQNNAAIGGNLSVAGTLTVGQGIQISGLLNAVGPALFQNQTNSTTAFQVQNSAGSQLINIDTTNPVTDLTSNGTNNIITNGSLEADTTGWAADGASASVARETTLRYLGTSSLAVTTPATATRGAKYNLTTTTLASNTKYTLTLSARMAQNATMSTFEIGHADNGSTHTSCLTAQIIDNTGWKTFTCTFTTGTTSSTPFIYVNQTDATARTFYVDAVQLTRFSLLTNASIEQAVAGNWVAEAAGGTVTQDSTLFFDGSKSLKIVTATGATGRGAKQNITLADSTRYNLSFYAISTGTAIATMEAGYAADGSTETGCTTAQTVPNGDWVLFTCSFTTPTSHSGTPYLYIKNTANSARTWFVDVVQLTLGNPLTAYQEGQIALNGVINSPAVFQNQADSSSAFQIQTAKGGNLFQVDSQNSNITLLGNNIGETGPWQTNGSSGLTAIDSACTVTANGYAYVIGGATVNTVQYAKLNAGGSLGNWSTTTAINVGGAQNRAAPGCTVANGYVYVIAGSSNNGDSGVTTTTYYAKLSLDGTVGAWASTTAIPAARWGLTAHTYNGYLYAVGGVNSGGGPNGNVYIAKLNGDGTIGAWSNTSPFTTGAGQHSSTIANGYLYVISGAGSVVKVQYAKLGANGVPATWASTTDLPEERAYTSAVVANGYLYVIGGINAGSNANIRATVYYAQLNSDGTVGTWNTAVQQLPAGREAFGNGLYANGYMYAIGGWSGSAQTSTQYYASVSRTTIGGGLDLVGLSGENLSEGGSGGELTAGSTTVVGSLNVRDQANFAGGATIASTLTVAGATSLKGIQGSTGFLQVQNAGGITAFNVNTVNLVGAGSFENGTNTITPEGWSAKGAGTPTIDTSQALYGANSMKIVTTTANNDGAKFIMPLSENTQYTLSFYAKVSSGSITDVQAGRSDDGTTNTDCFGGGQTITTAWTRLSCTFTTSSIAVTGNTYFYISKALASAETFFVDGVQLEAAAAATSYRESDIKLDGQVTFKNSADSTTAFQIQTAAGTTLFGIDTVNSRIFSGVANGSTAIGFILNTTNSFSTAGAKLLSLQNATSEKFAIDKDGNIFIADGAALAFQGVGRTKNVVTKKFTCTAATSAGDVVIIDGTNNGQVTTTTTADDAKVIGVVSVGAGAGATCEVAVSGVIQASINGAVARGDLLTTSTTAGQGKVNNTPGAGTIFGKALETTGGAGLAWVVLWGG